MPLNAYTLSFNLWVVSQIDKAVYSLKSSKAKYVFWMVIILIFKSQRIFHITVMNKFIQKSSFPEPWKCNVITPFFKSSKSCKIQSQQTDKHTSSSLQGNGKKNVVERIVEYLNISPYTLNRKEFDCRKHNSTEMAIYFFL